VQDADVTIIARRDAPGAVVMSLDTFHGWQETVHLLKVPSNAAHSPKSNRQLRAGKAKPHDLVNACSGRLPLGPTTSGGRDRTARRSSASTR
jgi:antitoxin YefM